MGPPGRVTGRTCPGAGGSAASRNSSTPSLGTCSPLAAKVAATSGPCTATSAAMTCTQARGRWGRLCCSRFACRASSSGNRPSSANAHTVRAPPLPLAAARATKASSPRTQRVEFHAAMRRGGRRECTPQRHTGGRDTMKGYTRPSAATCGAGAGGAGADGGAAAAGSVAATAAAIGVDTAVAWATGLSPPGVAVATAAGAASASAQSEQSSWDTRTHRVSPWATGMGAGSMHTHCSQCSRGSVPSPVGAVDMTTPGVITAVQCNACSTPTAHSTQHPRRRGRTSRGRMHARVHPSVQGTYHAGPTMLPPRFATHRPHPSRPAGASARRHLRTRRRHTHHAVHLAGLGDHQGHHHVPPLAARRRPKIKLQHRGATGVG